jgi:hypothetical protein
MNYRQFLAITVCVGGLAWMPSITLAQSENDPVRIVLKIPERCYPLAINPTTEQITTVCRGQEGWNPDGLQLFEQETVGTSYQNRRTGRFSTLLQDIRSGVGPVPWFTDRWLIELDRNNIARPR